jgi:hypothetical protein
MTLFICKTMGSRFRQKSTDGTVLNVFDSTVNIRTDEDELFILSLGKVPSPVTANISRADPELRDAFSDFVFAGDRACFTAGNNNAEISLGRAVVLLDRPDYFENEIQRFHERVLPNFLIHDEYLFYALRECADSRLGCLLNPDMTTRGLLPEFLATVYDGTDTIDIASHGTISGLRAALLGLCGRGPGFTPAGDDFISGFVTMLNCLRSSLNLGPAIIPGSEFARLTTWTSFKLIEYNAMGLVDVEIEGLINSAARGDVLSYADKIRSLSKRGHTSGLDYSTGATFALCMAAGSIIKGRSRSANLVKLASSALK